MASRMSLPEASTPFEASPEEKPHDVEARLGEEIDQLSAIINELSLQSGIEQEAWENFIEVLEPLKKYPSTYAHGLRVGVYAYHLAEAEGQPDLHLPFFGGCAHDLGKSKIDKEILEATGPGPFDKEQIKPHAERGFRALKKAGFPFTAFIAGAHHLYQDDPYGIDLASQKLLADPDDLAHVESVARLVALADQFDAMTTRRNDRTAATWGNEAAQRAELMKNFTTEQDEVRIDWLFANKLA